jgi:hypothetical protein
MIALFVNVKNGNNMPSMNTFGGCDPFVEVRCVKGDPSEKGGDVKTKPRDGCFAKTKELSGQTNPVWNQTIILPKAIFENDSFVNIILWDHNRSENSTIGYQHVALSQLLQGMQFDASLDELPQKDFVAAAFQSLLDSPIEGFFPGVNMAFSFCEVHKFRFKIDLCSALPKVDKDALDTYVEVRLCDQDPRNEKYPISGKHCLWTAKTKTVKDKTDPKFSEELEGICPANPKLFFQVVVIQSKKLLNQPIGAVVIPMVGLCGQKSGEREFTSTLTKLPNYSEAAGLSSASIKFKICHDRASTLA